MKIYEMFLILPWYALFFITQYYLLFLAKNSYWNQLKCMYKMYFKNSSTLIVTIATSFNLVILTTLIISFFHQDVV